MQDRNQSNVLCVLLSKKLLNAFQHAISRRALAAAPREPSKPIQSFDSQHLQPLPIFREDPHSLHSSRSSQPLFFEEDHDEQQPLFFGEDVDEEDNDEEPSTPSAISEAEEEQEQGSVNEDESSSAENEDYEQGRDSTDEGEADDLDDEELALVGAIRYSPNATPLSLNTIKNRLSNILRRFTILNSSLAVHGRLHKDILKVIECPKRQKRMYPTGMKTKVQNDNEIVAVF